MRWHIKQNNIGKTISGLLSIILLSVMLATDASAQIFNRFPLYRKLGISVVPPSGAVKRVYIADDDHTDLMWSLLPAAYDTALTGMLNWYTKMAYISDTASSADFKYKFNTDGWYWLWRYESTKTQAQRDSLWTKIASGNISSPINEITMTYGAMNTEGVIRSMYKAGEYERAHNIRFYLVSAMENQTLPLGTASLWAGAGAKYMWHGICNCVTPVQNLQQSRGREIYYATGLDGRKILLKWNSMISPSNGSQDLGGYAEGRYDLRATLGHVSNNAGFKQRWPRDSVTAIFGYGWDDNSHYTSLFPQVARDSSNANRRVIVSNELDFFQDIEQKPDSIPTYSASFGNDWDVLPATLAEVTAQMKRNIEDLRTGEALASVVSTIDTTANYALRLQRDSAMIYSGLYFQQNWTGDSPYGYSAYVDDSAKVWSARVKRYTDALKSRMGDTLASRIKKTQDSVMFYAFNPLSWRRTGVADFKYSPPTVFKVIDMKTGTEVRSQKYTRSGVDYVRILATDVPSVGYKVYRLDRSIPPSLTDSAAFIKSDTLYNSRFKLRLSTNGSITYLRDLLNSETWTSGGGFDSLNASSSSGSVSWENGGPVSTTIVASVIGVPNRTVRVTLYYGTNQIDIENEITQNISGTYTYGFRFNLASPSIYHEELGAILKAATTTNGGNYSTYQALYAYLTANHFIAVNNGTTGMTLSNWDSQFFVAGNSNNTTLDGTTPYIRPVVGGLLSSAITAPPTNQFGDLYFKNRYSLRRDGAFNRTVSMKFALEHQNPFYTDTLKGNAGGVFSDTAYTFLAVSDTNVLLWALKPAQESNRGIVTRLWSMRSDTGNATVTFPNHVLNSVYNTTSIETDLSSVSLSGANSFVGGTPLYGMQTYRMLISPVVEDQTNYYINTETGNDGNTGHSQMGAWKTIAKLNTATLNPGDSVFFNRGSSFYGELTVGQSGTSTKPIVIGAYGVGSKPIITGGKAITGWVARGSYYAAKADTPIVNLFANGSQMTLARFPNSGYATIATTNGTTTITSSSLNQASGYWNGGQATIKTAAWVLDVRDIASYDGTTLTLSSATSKTMAADWGFYVSNCLNALDSPGEWYCNPSTDSVYFWAPGGVNPNTLTVIGSGISYGIKTTKNSITIRDLNFTYQGQSSIYNDNGDTLRIISNDMYYPRVYGIQFIGSICYAALIDSNTVRGANAGGISATTSTRNSIISHNTITNIGSQPGFALQNVDANRMVGISLEDNAKYNVIRYNTIDSTGYIGINSSTDANYCLIEKNYIKNSMLYLGDGGGIYTANVTNDTIQNNIVVYSPGNTDGMPSGSYKEGNGIYLDGYSSNCLIYNNTVSKAGFAGYYMQYGSYNNTLRSNTSWNSGSNTDGAQLWFLQNTTLNYGGNSIKRNMFFSHTNTQRNVYLQEWNTYASYVSIGTVDSNYYCNPYSMSYPFYIITQEPAWTGHNLTLADWKTKTAQDSHSSDWYTTIPPAGSDTLLINPTNSDSIFATGSYWRDVTGTQVGPSITVPAFSSKVLTYESSSGGITYDNSTSGGTGWGTSASASLTIGSGTNRALVVVTHAGSNASGVTVGGNALTLLGRHAGGLPMRGEVWYIANPPSGSQTVSVTWTTTASNYFTAISYTGVDQTTPMDGFISGEDNSGLVTTKSITVTSRANDLVVGGCAMGVNATISDQSGQTQRSTFVNPALGWASEKSGAASVTFGYTWSATGPQIVVAAGNLRKAP